MSFSMAARSFTLSCQLAHDGNVRRQNVVHISGDSRVHGANDKRMLLGQMSAIKGAMSLVFKLKDILEAKKT